MYNKRLLLFLPIKTNYIILERISQKGNNHLLVYNGNYLQLLLTNNLFLNKYSSMLVMDSGVGPKKPYIEPFLLKFSTLSNKKLRFTGKGYKIIKKGLNLNLYLNTSHNQWVFTFKSIVIKTQKQKFLFLNKNSLELNTTISSILKVRPVNIFTKRGLRLNKQKIFKKIGKRST